MFGIRRRKSRAVLAKAELGESFDHLRQAATYAAGGVGGAVGPRVRTARAYVAPTATKIRNAPVATKMRSRTSDGWGSAVALLAPMAAITARRARRINTIPERVSGKMPKQLHKAIKKSPVMSSALIPGLVPGRMRSARKRLSPGRRWPAVAGLLVAGAVGTAGVLAWRRRQRSEWEAYDPAADLDVVHPHPDGATPTPDTRSTAGRPSGMASGPASGNGRSGGGGNRADGVLGSPATPSSGSPA